MSTKPGVSHAPWAAMRSRAALVIEPISTMRPSFTPTSALYGAAPVPSTTVAPSNSESSILAPPENRERHARHDVPDAPQARDDDHAQVGIELHGDDAERQPRVLHAAFDDDRAHVALADPERQRAQPAEHEAERVVQHDDRELRQDLQVQQLALPHQPDRDEREQREQAEVAERLA